MASCAVVNAAPAGRPAFAAWKAQIVAEAAKAGGDPETMRGLQHLALDGDVLVKSSEFVGFKQPLGDYIRIANAESFFGVAFGYRRSPHCEGGPLPRVLCDK